jgi:hypothetical protein
VLQIFARHGFAHAAAIGHMTAADGPVRLRLE